MKKRQEYGWLRGPKTLQEAKANCDSEFARAKRRPVNLPTLYDDIDIAVNREKGWKHRRKTQYHFGKRGQRHELVVDSCVYEWDFKDYCEKHRIPYKIETIRETYTYSLEVRKMVYRKGNRHYLDYRTGKWIWGLAYGYDWVGSGEYKDYKGSQTIGYKLVWWYDKDICVDRILNRHRR